MTMLFFETKEKESVTNRPDFQLLLKNFIDNSYGLFASVMDKRSYEQSLRSSIEQAVNSEMLYNKFMRGDFDEMIFSESPTITNELAYLIKEHNRIFVIRLFTKCPSMHILSFWLERGVELPKDSLALAVTMHSEKFLFEYLRTNEKYWPKEIDTRDKIELIEMASKTLAPEAFGYLQDALGVKLSQIQYANYQ